MILTWCLNRFVFDNFTWDRDGPEFSDYNGKLIPARIPMSAMISGEIPTSSIFVPPYWRGLHAGPLIGGPFPPGDDAPRAVSKNFFNEVCPNPTVIDSGEVNEPLRYDNDIGAQYMMDRWIEKLNSIADPCVEIAQESYQLFEIWWARPYLALYTPCWHVSPGYSVHVVYSTSGQPYPSHPSSQNSDGRLSSAQHSIPISVSSNLLLGFPPHGFPLYSERTLQLFQKLTSRTNRTRVSSYSTLERATLNTIVIILPTGHQIGMASTRSLNFPINFHHHQEVGAGTQHLKTALFTWSTVSPPSSKS